MYDTTIAKDEFQKWSQSYDKSILQLLLFGPSHRAIIRRLKAQFGNESFKVLDVGCGTGVFAERMRTALPKAEIWGIDLSSGMLDKGRTRFQAHSGHIVPIQGDSERLPFSNGSFDIVTCCNSFHHYPRQDCAVKEMRRVLAPGGRLMLIDGYRDGLWGRLIYDVCVAGVEGEVHHCSSRRFQDLFTDSGLVDMIQKVHRGFAPFLLNVATAPAIIPSPHITVAAEASSRPKAEIAGQKRNQA